MKKRILVFVLLTSILAANRTTYAATSSFNITVGGNHPDTKSVKTTKNPDDSDNNFYVTGYTSSNTAELVTAKSYNLSSPNKYYTKYGTMIVLNATQSAPYNCTVPHGVYYYMNTEFTNGSGSKVTMTGNYTP